MEEKTLNEIVNKGQLPRDAATSLHCLSPSVCDSDTFLQRNTIQHEVVSSENESRLYTGRQMAFIYNLLKRFLLNYLNIHINNWKQNKTKHRFCTHKLEKHRSWMLISKGELLPGPQLTLINWRNTCLTFLSSSWWIHFSRPPWTSIQFIRTNFGSCFPLPRFCKIEDH